MSWRRRPPKPYEMRLRGVVGLCEWDMTFTIKPSDDATDKNLRMIAAAVERGDVIVEVFSLDRVYPK